MNDNADHPLFVTDAQAARRVGVPVAVYRQAAAILERQGFPRPDPMFHDRRYWPAIRAFLDRRAGLDRSGLTLQPDGEEHWD
ncbi:winged helix-turn-helix domain-containing protein [Jiella sonneratiae]|uniref:Winged helix-turn-helix domain-containing protein n=1 Tax=Jiella sonneratiae TaxID=2816856 RepID=A0ABS3J3H7_9HYPH|nr:winged helix-turn-helix domain-containing protein [Jiella sonneratiae]MBO0904214.1 winged helix-turn-helix domain-containing protein [Jiella sonneratiae]